MRNRYVNRYLISMCFLFANIGFANAQIKLKGPEKAEPGDLVAVQIAADKVPDLKVQVLKDGKPTDIGWRAVKDFDNTPLVIIVTKNEGLYTVVAAGTVSGKVDLAMFAVQIGKITPIPTPTPTPTPQPTPPQPSVGLGTDLQTLYTKAPDPGTLEKLVSVFTEVKSSIAQLNNYGDFETVIVNTAKRSVGDDSKLRTIRDRIGDYLLQQTGPDPRLWDRAKAEKVCDDILAALKGIK